MDQTAIPFDIAAIPPSPFTPSFLAWALLLGVVSLLFLIVFFVLGRRKTLLNTPRMRLIRNLQDLQRHINQKNSREIASDAIQALARYEKFTSERSQQNSYLSIIKSQAFQALDLLRFSPLVEAQIVSNLIKSLEEDLLNAEDKQ